jgi:hypothetical protein
MYHFSKKEKPVRIAFPFPRIIFPECESKMMLSIKKIEPPT